VNLRLSGSSSSWFATANSNIALDQMPDVSRFDAPLGVTINVSGISEAPFENYELPSGGKIIFTNTQEQ
jgi:hypothetical protein